MDQGVVNVRSTFQRAMRTTPYGIGWYTDAHAELVTLANELELLPETAIGMAAALSPNMAWPQTVSAVKCMVREGDAQGFPQSRARARSILDGYDPKVVLSGPKVTAFYAALLTPFEPHEAVIDRHALSVWLGRPSSTYWQKWAWRHTPEVQQAYRIVSGQTGFYPHEVQAACWVWWKEIGREAQGHLD